MQNYESPVKSESSVESGYLDGKRYDIEKLYAFADAIPTEKASLEEFRSVISPENESWLGEDGKIIGPYNIFKDWESAQKNPLWRGHIESIKNVDLNVPILVSDSGHVVDGQHRVVKAFIEGMTEIDIKRLPKEIPKDLEI